MKYLLRHKTQILRRLHSAKQIFLFLDFDGTLSPIVKHPKDARLPAETRLILQKLKNNPRITLGIISGRSLKDIKRRAGIKSIYYAGNHGLEILLPSGRVIYPAGKKFNKALFKKLKAQLSRGLRGIKGAIIEDKGFCITVHYRLVKDKDLPRLKMAFRQAVREAVSKGPVRVSGGKKILEVKPPFKWGKAGAIAFIMEKGRAGKAGLIYLGDDLTDEAVFTRFKNAVTVFVGNPKARKSAAEYYLASPKKARKFLHELTRM